MPTRVCIDGNEAAARVAYALSETVALYPITPASPMGEHCDAWATAGRQNLWGSVPEVVQLQSEAGAAGTLHGALQAGSLATTFTASQGLLLMLPEMFKIAGELSPAVIHVAARTIATHALSIFGDHSDVMAARTTGWTMLASASPQEAHDLAAVSHAATLASRLPVLHFFDGFRTSHELGEVDLLDDEDLRALIDEEQVLDHRRRALDPDRPVLRGSAQNPDVFFQAREAANGFHDAVPDAVQAAMDRLAERTGRRYGVVERHGADDAERVLVLMGSGAVTAQRVVDHLAAAGERVAVITVRLFRPFPTEAFLAALPDTATRIAVLDRTKEPGAVGEPLYEEVVAALAEAALTGRRDALPDVVGGRYGLSSKEFTPAMVAAVLGELRRDRPRRRFTVGIVDDVTHLSLDVDARWHLPAADGDLDAVFVGLGSDGTVGATKNTAKILASRTDRHVQAYFVYDSKKSGAQTVSHLRTSGRPIAAPYLIDRADVVACHQFGLLDRVDVLGPLRVGGTVLLNAPFAAAEVFDRLPGDVQRVLVHKQARLFTLDAYRLAREAGLAGRINIAMQVAFLAVTGLLPADEVRAAVADAVRRTYAELGDLIVDRNLGVIDRVFDQIEQVPLDGRVPSDARRPAPLERAAGLRGDVAAPEDFVERVTARLLAGEGERLPVSALPVDGTFPTGTARWEKRSLAEELPTWDPSLCIDCGKCTIVCPHAAIQIKVFQPDAIDDAGDGFLSKPFKDRQLTGHLLTVQVAPDDCTGCGVCVESCPVVSRTQPGHRAIDMTPALAPVDDGTTVRDRERERYRAFESIPYLDRTDVRHDTVKHSQTLQPLFEFSGACAGCGETPYLKLLSQLFGDRSIVANATGCSSIYGGNLPTTPWGVDAHGRGPAWANSLFEDDAEFGLGIRLGVDHQRRLAIALLDRLAPHLGDQLVDLLRAGARARDEAGIAAQRAAVDELRRRLPDAPDEDGRFARHLATVAGSLVHRDVWIVGGDGWAYDIGFGGLDHVLASGHDVNVLVLDTEVYSNTGGQASKATPRGAVAKFATAGKATPKKDLAVLAMQYGHVYVARIALGADEMQTLRAFREAQAWPGPSLLLAYSTCIAHGVDMRDSMKHMDLAVRTGHWPLVRYHPDEREDAHPFRLDAKPPSVPLRELLRTETRYSVLASTDPECAAELADLAQADVDERWRYYEQLAGVERQQAPAPTEPRHDEVAR